MASTMNYLDVSTLTSNLTAAYNNEEVVVEERAVWNRQRTGSEAGATNEEIVVDERTAFSPTDLVQQKLQGLLPSSSIPVSCLHAGRQVRRYNA